MRKSAISWETVYLEPQITRPLLLSHLKSFVFKVQRTGNPLGNAMRWEGSEGSISYVKHKDKA